MPICYALDLKDFCEGSPSDFISNSVVEAGVLLLYLADSLLYNLLDLLERPQSARLVPLLHQDQAKADEPVPQYFLLLKLARKHSLIAEAEVLPLDLLSFALPERTSEVFRRIRRMSERECVRLALDLDDLRVVSERLLHILRVCEAIQLRVLVEFVERPHDGVRMASGGR